MKNTGRLYLVLSALLAAGCSESPVAPSLQAPAALSEAHGIPLPVPQVDPVPQVETCYPRVVVEEYSFSATSPTFPGFVGTGRVLLHVSRQVDEAGLAKVSGFAFFNNTIRPINGVQGSNGTYSVALSWTTRSGIPISAIVEFPAGANVVGYMNALYFVNGPELPQSVTWYLSLTRTKQTTGGGCRGGGGGGGNRG